VKRSADFQSAASQSFSLRGGSKACDDAFGLDACQLNTPTKGHGQL
jgi:hypothetical protein